MPHDKNGLEVKPGDIVRVPAVGGYVPHETIGAVKSVQYGSDKCNLSVEAIGKSVQNEHYASLPALQIMTVTASECEKLA